MNKSEKLKEILGESMVDKINEKDIDETIKFQNYLLKRDIPHIIMVGGICGIDGKVNDFLTMISIFCHKSKDKISKEDMIQAVELGYKSDKELLSDVIYSLNKLFNMEDK